MAAKLEYDVGVKTENAKKKIREDLGTVEVGGGAPSSPAQGAAAAADKAAKSLSSLGAEADRSTASISRAVKGFAGIGISMAASYAANRLPQGSFARDALDYGGGIAGGAVAGSAFGPWGTVIGGIAGALKTRLDKTGEQDAYMLNFQKSELRHSQTLAWKEKIDGLTDMGDSGQAEVEAKLAQVRSLLAQRKEAEAEILAKIKEYIEAGKYDSADFAQGSLEINRRQQLELQAIEKQTAARLEELDAGGVRAPSLAATDALTRIGGDFGGAQGASLDSVARNTGATKGILERIERKMTKGGTF